MAVAAKLLLSDPIRKDVSALGRAPFVTSSEPKLPWYTSSPSTTMPTTALVAPARPKRAP
jgi:hypothetical protein